MVSTAVSEFIILIKSKKLYYFFLKMVPKSPKMVNFTRTLYITFVIVQKSEKENRLRGQKTKLKKYWFVQEMVPWSDTATYTLFLVNL